MATTMRTHSYASDAGTRQWLLFAQQKKADAFTLTAVVSSSADGDAEEPRDATTGKRALYELQLDEHKLREHTEELGIEVNVDAFVELFKKTLENRAFVDVVVAQKEDHVPEKVNLLLTYKFSESISRKGCFELPLLAADIPEQVVKLLLDLHATPHEPLLTEAQKRQRNVMANSTAMNARSAASISSSLMSSFASQGAGSSQYQGEPLQSSSVADANGNGASDSTTPQLLKRRHVPSGTIRRKGPKGAKLAKN